MVEPGAPIPEGLAKRVRLVVFDVDGVLTDAGVYLGTVEDGGHVELKRFNIQDGIGLKMLKVAGMEVIMVSGRISDATSRRALELDVECYQDNNAQKVPTIVSVMKRLEVGWDEVAMLGDDIPDLAVLRKVGLKAAVANAVPVVAGMAHWRSTRTGGHGAAREFSDALLTARGQLQDVMEAYVLERS